MPRSSKAVKPAAKKTSKPTAKTKPKGTAFTDRSQPRADLVETCITACRPTDRQPNAAVIVESAEPTESHVGVCRKTYVVPPNPAEQSAVGMFRRGVSIDQIALGTGLAIARLVRLLGLEDALTPAEIHALEDWQINYGLPPSINLPRSVKI
jgi:hypothetical protein